METALLTRAHIVRAVLDFLQQIPGESCGPKREAPGSALEVRPTMPGSDARRRVASGRERRLPKDFSSDRWI